MPIRFRCVYCNQLLAISRRKAGSIVRCTTCAGQLIVPDPAEGSTEAAEPKPSAVAPAMPSERTEKKDDLFEIGDFDDLLRPLNPSPSQAAVADPPSVRRDRTASPTAPPLVTRVAASGLVLSRTHVTILCGGVILALGLAFAGGMLLGLSLRGG